MAFSDEEIAYLQSQPIARLGMVGPGLYSRITPRVSWSWNLAGEPAGERWYDAKRTVHNP